MKKIFLGFICAVACLSLNANAAKTTSQTQQSVPASAQMKFLGKFNAGVPNAGIYKMYDSSDDVVCYILMPDIPETKRTSQGIMYGGNSIGSISCIKVKLHVVPIRENSAFSGR